MYIYTSDINVLKDVMLQYLDGVSYINNKIKSGYI